MDETNNNYLDVGNDKSDGSSVQFIGRKLGSRKRLCIDSGSSSDCSSENITTNNSIGRKRSCNPAKWARNVQKNRRIKGLEYRNRRGNVIPAKTFIDVICRCRQKCNEKITSDERKAAMEEFYNLGSQLEQNIFLRGCIKVKKIKRRRPKDNSKMPRSRSFTYYFRKNRKNDISVCKKYFKDTYQISVGRIYDCCYKVVEIHTS